MIQIRLTYPSHEDEKNGINTEHISMWGPSNASTNPGTQSWVVVENAGIIYVLETVDEIEVLIREAKQQHAQDLAIGALRAKRAGWVP